MRSLHTPQQETNVAYNPGVSYRGGEFIAQGISQAGNAITAGLQRYAQNREESAALDMSFQTRAQPLLEEMQKFSAKDGQVSPAASLVDKGADWHKFSSSQKKAFLADVVLMGDKQDRARRQQQEDDFRKAAQQFRQDEFTATEKHRRFQEGQGAINTILSGYNQYKDNARADERLSMDRQNFANLEAARRSRMASDARMAGNLAQFQSLAGEPTGPSRMGGDAAAALLSQPGTRLPDFSRYGPQDTQLTQQPLSTDRIAQLGAQTGAWQHPQFNDLAKLYQGARLDPISQLNADAAMMNAQTNAAEAARRATGGAAGKAPPLIYKTVRGKDGVDYKVPMTQADYAAEQAANPPAAEMKKRGDRAALEEELRQHETALKAGNDDRYGFGNAYSRQNRVVELKRKLAELGASTAPAASSPSRGQAIRYKLVNGQLVPE